MLRIGIAGLGFMGMTHYHAIQRVNGARVEAIATRDPKKRAGDWSGIQGNFGPRGGPMDLSKIRTYADAGAMIADPDLDLIDICLPNPLHCETTLAALQAGKHVLLEKPIAVDPADGRQMIEAARAANRKLLVAHVLPFVPAFRMALEIVRSGAHGRLLAAHFKRIIGKSDWSKSTSGGPAIDLHIHDAHFIRLLAGPPKAVYARGIDAGGAVRYLATHYLYADQNLAVTCASGGISMRGRSFAHGFEIYLERGTLVFESAIRDGKAAAVTPLTLLDAEGRANTLLSENPGPEEAFSAEIQYAVDAVAGRNSGETLSAETALSALELCHLEVESVRTGRVAEVR